jgi:hypothetical protein
VAEKLQLGPRTAGKVVPKGVPAEVPAEEIPIIEDEGIDIKDIPF